METATTTFGNKIYTLIQDSGCIDTPKGSVRVIVVMEGQLAWGKNGVKYGVLLLTKKGGENWVERGFASPLTTGEAGLEVSKKFVADQLAKIQAVTA